MEFLSLFSFIYIYISKDHLLLLEDYYYNYAVHYIEKPRESLYILLPEYNIVLILNHLHLLSYHFNYFRNTTEYEFPYLISTSPRTFV